MRRTIFDFTSLLIRFLNHLTIVPNPFNCFNIQLKTAVTPLPNFRTMSWCVDNKNSLLASKCRFSENVSHHHKSAWSTQKSAEQVTCIPLNWPDGNLSSFRWPIKGYQNIFRHKAPSRENCLFFCERLKIVIEKEVGLQSVAKRPLRNTTNYLFYILFECRGLSVFALLPDFRVMFATTNAFKSNKTNLFRSIWNANIHLTGG